MLEHSGIVISGSYLEGVWIDDSFLDNSLIGIESFLQLLLFPIHLNIINSRKSSTASQAMPILWMESYKVLFD